MTKQKQRGHNEGSIYQRKDGRWVAAVTVDATRKRKSFYGATRKEVSEQLKIALREQQQGLPVAVERQTMAQFLDRWLADDVKPTRQPKTYISYADTVRVHITPELGRHQLARLAPPHLQALLTAKRASGLSPRSVADIRTVLRIALNRAMKWGLVSRNVAALVDPPRVVRREVRPLTPEQARRFLDAAKGDRLEALYSVAIALGLRSGEALGLRWEDVDLDGRTLRVRFALQRIDGKLTLKEPKTEKSKRTVSMPDATVRALRAHRIRQVEERLLAGSRWQDRGFVFASTIGTPLEPSNVLKQFKAILERAELPKQRFHDLRHCCASLLLAQGVPARVVMDILGHTQIATTMDLYSHVMPAAQRDAADLMDAILVARG